MDFRTAQQQIDSVLRILNEVERCPGLRREDPSVIALREIMLAKVAALEAAKLKNDDPIDEKRPRPEGEI